MNRYFSIIFFLLACVLQTRAEVKLPAFFSDNMVLQQQSHVKIRGMVTGRKIVKVKTSWDNVVHYAKASSNGQWDVNVKTPSAGGPYSIAIRQENEVILKNVLVGEVWICSGQSNMDMPMQGYNGLPILNSADILLESPNSKLRLFHVGKAFSDKPQTDVKGSWQQANAGSVSTFSAVGYQFAAILQKYLDVPVGIIQTTWGGSPIEAWTDRQVLDSLLGERLVSDKAISKASHQTPGNLYNAMVKPLAGFNIAGVIWYQGEQNRHNHQDYLMLQKAMVNLWRKEWGTGKWPFYGVQLAPMYYTKETGLAVPLTREAQLKLTDSLDNTGMAITIDAGEEYNIHPANKTIVAKRLALLALDKTYHQKGIVSSGPGYLKMNIKNDTVVVKFSNAILGMTSYGKKITQFELAGTDRIFHSALAVIKDDQVILKSNDVHKPVAVRYAFKDWCVGELYNTEGLPASPFRTDSW